MDGKEAILFPFPLNYYKTIRKLYPNMKEDEVQLLASIVTKKELKEQLILLGWDDKDIKAELK